MGSINALFAEGNRGLTKPLPDFPEIEREVARERLFGGGPAIVGLARLDPLLAVVALAVSHDFILWARCHRPV
jgi:hypothetical protein